MHSRIRDDSFADLNDETKASSVVRRTRSPVSVLLCVAASHTCCFNIQYAIENVIIDNVLGIASAVQPHGILVFYSPVCYGLSSYDVFTNNTERLEIARVGKENIG